MERRPPGEPFGLTPDEAEPLDEREPLEEGEPLGGDAAPRGLIPEGVKKAILAGVGALFMTEEGARRLAREWKLPKEVVGFIGGQAQAAKDEILRTLGAEVRRFLESEAIRREFLKGLADSTIEIRAEIRLRSSADGEVRPEVEATGGVRAGSGRPRRRRKKATP
jgi:hypothetical protein